MNIHPDHPVRRQSRFIMLRELSIGLGKEPEINNHRFGAKISAARGEGSGFFWCKPTWHYGSTALIALDAALAYLVSEALHE